MKFVDRFRVFSACGALVLPVLLSSCTYSITMVHTQGEATDVVDETATNTPSTSVSIPVSATSLPGLPGASTTVTK